MKIYPQAAGKQNKVKSMRDSQLDKMSLKDLTSLHAKVQAAIDEKRVSERGEMRAKMEEMARASGFSVAGGDRARAGLGGGGGICVAGAASGVRDPDVDDAELVADDFGRAGHSVVPGEHGDAADLGRSGVADVGL